MYVYYVVHAQHLTMSVILCLKCFFKCVPLRDNVCYILEMSFMHIFILLLCVMRPTK